MVNYNEPPDASYYRYMRDTHQSMYGNGNDGCTVHVHNHYDSKPETTVSKACDAITESTMERRQVVDNGAQSDAPPKTVIISFNVEL